MQLAWTIPHVAQLHEGEELIKGRRGEAVMIVLNARRVTYSHRQSCTGRRRDNRRQSREEKWKEEQVAGAGDSRGRTQVVQLRRVNMLRVA